METATKFPKLYTTAQAGAILHRHHVTMQNDRKKNQGPEWIKIGGRYFYTEEALREFLKTCGRDQE